MTDAQYLHLLTVLASASVRASAELADARAREWWLSLTDLERAQIAAMARPRVARCLDVEGHDVTERRSA